MGKATRWLKGLFGMKNKNKENLENNSNFGQKEQNKHAIAVAAAAQAAAAAVLRLTSHGGGRVYTGGRENLAAVKIQAVFRGYLARKALRALRGLVKLQAHFRGYLVRKRADATLHSMQALIRAQYAIRLQRAARRSIKNDHGARPEMRARKSIERFDEIRSDFHSKRLSGSYNPPLDAFDERLKIVEIDTCGPRSRSRRMSTCGPEYGDDFDYGFIEEDYKFATAHNTPRFACTGRATPSKSVCGDSFFRPYSNYPNYMTNTQSFRAKLRSHSAPRQRPETGPKKRLSLNEIMASRTSFTGVRMQK